MSQDRETIRNIVRDELDNQQFRQALWQSLFKSGPPITRDQANDLIDGKLGKYSQNLSTQVTNEVERSLVNKSGVKSMLDAHQRTVQQKLESNKHDLELAHKRQLEKTKEEMSAQSKLVVTNLINTDEGSSIVKGIENRLSDRQDRLFYSNICLGLAAGLLGGVISSSLNK